MIFEEKPEVQGVLDIYPKQIQPYLQKLKQIIIETAENTEGVKKLVETLKWGEASYISNGGSTIRIGWKASNPKNYAMYFICSTNLVETFKLIHGSTFQYEKNRAIVFHIKDEIPVLELKHCISLALTYHKIKHLPMLGV